MIKRKIITSLFIIIICINNISYGIFIPNVYQSEDKKILAFAEINAATLTLQGGERIETTNINGDTSMSITTITSPIELILVIDISGSMTGSSLESTKQSASTLVENLFEIATKIQVSVITFESKAELLITSNDKDMVISKINGLQATGGTNMSPALDIAEELFNKNLNSEDEIIYPYLVVLTDGATNDAAACYEKLLNLQQKQITIYNILVGNAPTYAFSQDGVDAGIIYENITSDQINSIYDEIYFQICSDFIDNDVSDFIADAQNYFVTDDGLYLYLDSELTHGTLLEIEYLINIKCAMDCTELILQNEVDPKLSFSADAKLISEDNTNAYYGWKVNESISYTETEDMKHNLVLTLKPTSDSNYIIKKGETFQCKLILSCLLTTGIDANFVNSLTFRVKGQQNTSQGSQEVVVTQTLDSLETNVIPPFGKDLSNISIYVLIVILVVIAIAIFITKKVKLTTKKKKKL